MQKYIKLIKKKIKQYVIKHPYPNRSFLDMCKYLEIEMHGTYDVHNDEEWDAFNNAMLSSLIKENPLESSDLVERYGTAEQIYAHANWAMQKQESDNLAMRYGQGDHSIRMEDLEWERSEADKSWNEFIATIKGE